MEESQILELARQIEIKTLCEAWELSENAVRARLTGKRALTLEEVGAVADLVGIDLLFHSLHRTFSDHHRVKA